MSRAFIGVGSNLGDRLQALQQAQAFAAQTEGIQFLRSSPIHETEPVGGPPQNHYLNAVWEIETDLTARELLAKLLEIEKRMGRIRAGKNYPRHIDLDLLCYDQEICNQENLILPHPRMHEREFVLRPLSELAPDWMHPRLNKSVQSLLEDVLEKSSQS